MKKLVLVGLLLAGLLLSACAPLSNPTTDATVSSQTQSGSSQGTVDSDGSTQTDETTDTVLQVSDGGATEDAVGQYGASLTETELRSAYETAVKYPAEMVPASLQGYGRILTSAATVEEAISNATAYFTTADRDVKECTVLVESELYYGLSVSQGPKGSDQVTSQQKVVCFKTHVFQTDYLTVYRDKTATFGSVSKGVAKRLMDYWSYSRWIDDGAIKILGSEIQEEGTEYCYTVYYLNPLYDDFGEVSEVSYYRVATRIPKAGGTVTLGKTEKLLTAKL